MRSKSIFADLLFQRHKADEYAAIYVAGALHEAGRGKEIIGLLENESQPSAIQDPLVRREVQLQRFRIGLSVATEHENIADSIRTMLYGAEALKTEAAIRDLVVKNPDLAVAFMDSAYKLILTDPDQVEH